MLFLQETKCNKALIEKLRVKLGRNFEVLEIESKGREGGLATFWDTRRYQILTAEASKNYLALEVQPTERHLDAKFILGGDFNMITSLLEKKGGIRKLNRDGEVFISFIDNARLVDVHPKNGKFTWNNRRGGERLISSRLDRFLVSESLILDGTVVESNILPSRGSDHWPISLAVEIQGTPGTNPSGSKSSG
eukprot:PITA_28553